MISSYRIKALGFLGFFLYVGQICHAAPCTCQVLPITKICASGWTVVPGQTVITSTYSGLAEDTDQTTGCPYAGANDPHEECSVTGSSIEVTKTQVTGDIDFEVFGLSVTIEGGIDKTETVTAQCGGASVLNNWCTCCAERARVRYKVKTMTQNCSCLGCSSNRTGSVTWYDGIVCDSPACTPPASPPCVAPCPPAS